VALVLARYLIGMLVGGTAVLWLAAWTYLNKPRGARPWALRMRAAHQAGCRPRPVQLIATHQALHPREWLVLRRSRAFHSTDKTARLMEMWRVQFGVGVGCGFYAC
jgi:hypothetical protein